MPTFALVCQHTRSGKFTRYLDMCGDNDSIKTMIGLCMAIPTSRKGPTRYQLTQLKKFVMENGFGQSIIQVDNEPAILQLVQEAATELTIRVSILGDILHHRHIKDKVQLNIFTRHSSHKFV
eukprot:1001008-Amphidinium_carterae.3